MDFSSEQIVEMINNFYTAYPYALENIEEFPEVKELLENGYAYADEENNIYLSKKGDDFFHKYIKIYSEQFISFFSRNGYRSSACLLSTWMQSTFSIKDAFEANVFIDYIINNIFNYGYKANISLNSLEKWIELEKV